MRPSRFTLEQLLEACDDVIAKRQTDIDTKAALKIDIASYLVAPLPRKFMECHDAIMCRLYRNDGAASIRHIREQLFDLVTTTEQEEIRVARSLKIVDWILAEETGYQSSPTIPPTTETAQTTPSQTTQTTIPQPQRFYPTVTPLCKDGESQTYDTTETKTASMQTDEQFDKEQFDKVFEEVGMDINDDIDPVPEKPDLSFFRQLVDKLSTTSKNKVVSVGMWHTYWKGMPNLNAYVPSHNYPNEKWQITKLAVGGFDCKRVPIHVVHPEMGGVSNDNSQSYGTDEERPFKTLLLAKYMDITMLTFVDMELYAELKGVVLEAGVVPTTHAMLHKKANAFLRKYRTNHLDAVMMLEVKQWTVLAAMQPTKSEMLALRFIAKGRTMRDMGSLARFKRTGEVTTSWLHGWSFPKPLMCGLTKRMYKPSD